MYKTNEYCADCGTENEFEFENVEQLNPIQKCCECQRTLVLCSECDQEGCKDCVKACNFKQYAE